MRKLYVLTALLALSALVPSMVQANRSKMPQPQTAAKARTAAEEAAAEEAAAREAAVRARAAAAIRRTYRGKQKAKKEAEIVRAVAAIRRTYRGKQKAKKEAEIVRAVEEGRSKIQRAVEEGRSKIQRAQQAAVIQRLNRMIDPTEALEVFSHDAPTGAITPSAQDQKAAEEAKEAKEAEEAATELIEAGPQNLSESRARVKILTSMRYPSSAQVQKAVREAAAARAEEAKKRLIEGLDL